jgi:hypothetical protein
VGDIQGGAAADLSMGMSYYVLQLDLVLLADTEPNYKPSPPSMPFLLKILHTSLWTSRVSGTRYRSSATLLQLTCSQVVLIVNVASECGYTPQYTGLQELHQLYGSHGLEILGYLEFLLASS